MTIMSVYTKEGATIADSVKVDIIPRMGEYVTDRWGRDYLVIKVRYFLESGMYVLTVEQEIIQ